MEHTLRWLPELGKLPRDLAREPWRVETKPGERIKVKPFKDSPLWFCAANRVNWDYEYFWLPGFAYKVRQARTEKINSEFNLGRDYPRPMVPPLNLEIDLDALPVSHSWGDTDPRDRPHVWGTPGTLDEDETTYHTKSKGNGKGKTRKGKADMLRDRAYRSGYERQRVDKRHRVASEFYTKAMGA